MAALLVWSMAACTTNSTSSSSTTSTESSQSSSTSSDSASSSDSQAESSSSTDSTATTTPTSTNSSDVTFDDSDSDISEENAQTITLNGDSITSSSAKVDGTTVSITEAGTYIITGTLNDGQILVEEDNKGTVHLILAGASITSKTSAAIYIKNSGKTIITLKEGTVNSLTDASEYTNVDTEENEPSACLFSKDDLTINGSGTLNITANYNDGITCKDDLKIMSGELNINSKDDGIVGRDLLAVKDGAITIVSGGDGLKATNDTTENSGNVYLLGGSFNITSTADGIQAVTSLNISGGSYNINAGGGHGNAAAHTQSMPGGMGTGTTSSSDTSDESTSCKAIKATGSINISDGTFVIDSADDAVHSNGQISLAGGNFTIDTGDDAVHADTKLTVDDCNMTVNSCYEGLESAEIIINGGIVNITASDDGINAAGGVDSSQSSGTGMFGGDSFSTSTGTLTINGGTLYVNAAGDGLDANGTMAMTGGFVTVDGPTDDGNGALDYDGTFEISGGTLIAGGSSGMAQTPSDGSSVYTIFVGTSQSAGTEIKLLDSSGKELITYTPSKQISCVVFSSPDIKNGETYTVTAGGSEVGSCTVSSYCTTIGNVTASSGGSMGGGMGGRGQMPQQNGGMTPPTGKSGTTA